MNPSEDPSDRLLDSLLSEQARCKPDHALLSAVSSKLGPRASGRPGDRSVSYFWSAAAAILLLAAGGVWWSDFHQADDLLPELTVDKAKELVPAGKALPPVTHEAGVSVESPGIAVEDVSPAALEQQEPGEGFVLARGILWESSKSLPEVYAHDPDARGKQQGVKFEVSGMPGSPRQSLPIAGKSIVFTSSPDPGSLEDPTLVVARHRFEENYRSCTFIFLPAGGIHPAQPDWRLLVIDDSVRVFPPGSALVFNLSPGDLRYSAGEQIHRIKAGERVLFENLAMDATTKVTGEEFVDDRWRVFYSAVWPSLIEGRMLVFVHQDQDGLQVTSFRDGVR